jgi:arginyl-tRNA synthetase
MNIKTTLEQRISSALAAAGILDAPAMVALSGRPEFGDYQANGCMAAAKKMKTNPRQLAETVLQHLDLSDLAEKVELAGPGFINIFLNRDWLNNQLVAITSDEKLGVPIPTKLETAVVDYYQPKPCKGNARRPSEIDDHR